MQEHDLLKDPLERIKYLTAARIGSFSLGSGKFGLKNPLNPILGETNVFTTGRGSQLYLEQTCHHPPISHFHFIGPKEMPFEIFGYFDVTLNIKGMFSSIISHFVGPMTLKLPD